MSNSVAITPTIFTNARTQAVTYGYRAYDDYSQTYCNTLESIPDDDLDFLRMVVESADEVVSDMLDYVVDYEKTIDIDGTFYTYDEIKMIIS